MYLRFEITVNNVVLAEKVKRLQELGAESKVFKGHIENVSQSTKAMWRNIAFNLTDKEHTA